LQVPVLGQSEFCVQDAPVVLQVPPVIGHVALLAHDCDVPWQTLEQSLADEQAVPVLLHVPGTIGQSGEFAPCVVQVCDVVTAQKLCITQVGAV